jgi:uncharacterized membrane protein
MDRETGLGGTVDEREGVMGMMGMALTMALVVAIVIVLGILVIVVVSRVGGVKIKLEPLDEHDEKPKRGRAILTEDGELLEIVDSEDETREQPKQDHQA